MALRFLALVLGAAAAAELQVTVYDGPKECDEDTKVKVGDNLKMHYTGTIDQSSTAGEKGKKFDSSRDRGSTFDVQIGRGRVIKGWDEGLVGLCKGAKATLVIPPDMGYGERGAGADIPGGATLNFDAEARASRLFADAVGAFCAQSRAPCRRAARAPARPGLRRPRRGRRAPGRRDAQLRRRGRRHHRGAARAEHLQGPRR